MSALSRAAWCVFLLSVAAVAGAEWQERLVLPDAAGNLSLNCRWTPSRGLHFRVQAPDGGKLVELTVTGREASAKVAGQTVPTVRVNLDGLPDRRIDDAAVVLKFRPYAWTVYVQDWPALELPAPFAPPASVSQPDDELPAEPVARYQKVSRYSFHDAFMVEPTEKKTLTAWSKESGEWALRSALDDALEQKSSPRLASRPLEAERSPNFFCLLGTGEEAKIVAGYAFCDQYRYDASMLLDEGEVGLLFY